MSEQAVFTTPSNQSLIVQSARGLETLESPYRFEIRVLAPNNPIAPDTLLGEMGTFTIPLTGGGRRVWTGYVRKVDLLPPTGAYFTYGIHLVPWTGLLSEQQDARIFQNKSVVEICEEVYGIHGFSNYETGKLVRSYPKRIYCAQYQETALEFTTRIMQEEGIYSYYRQEPGRHVLVLADGPASHGAFKMGRPQIAYEPGGWEKGTMTEGISLWEHSDGLTTGKAAIQGYDFTKPQASALGSFQEQSARFGGGFERFEYPGTVERRDEADHYSRLRLEEWRMPGRNASGKTQSRIFETGSTFALSNHPHAPWNREYLATTVEHLVQSSNPTSSQHSSPGPFYECRFSAIPSDKPFRPARTLPKPFIRGPQTARVTGPRGEEIHTDPEGHGRVKVQFPWDRYGRQDERTSCWVRVMQSLAGNGWGGQAIPRVGQEVVVQFENGDPDKPLVTGTVYNGENRPPYALPQHKTRTLMKTRSTPAGNGFNELRFEDRAGKEQVFLHAERDMDVRVKGVRREYIRQDNHRVVENNQRTRVSGQDDRVVGGDSQTKVGGRSLLEAGLEIHVKSGTRLTLDAGAGLTLRCGGNFIEITPACINIEGTLVNINCGASTAKGPDCKPEKPQIADDGTKGDALS